MKKKTYKRFEDCIAVRGYFRSVIIDITRKIYQFIPNIMCDGILTNKLVDTNLSQEYMDFLIENEFIFECTEDELAFYPPLNTKWDYPAYITNAIIEISKIQFITDEFLKQIIDLGCRHFVFIFNESIKIELLEQISKLFDETPVLTIEIYFKYSKDCNSKMLENLMIQNSRISYILLYESPKDEIISPTHIRGNIVYYSKPVFYDECSINSQIFAVDMSLYTESLHFNTFYNRKLCIDKNGNIKNYFTQKKSFGNIFSDKIEDAILKKSFQKIWKVRKDLIDVCKDCEFRYMCVDSRFPLLRCKGSYYHSKECPYNPYICKWKNEEGYVPIAECGAYTKEMGFVPDETKIEELNKQIWGNEDE
jgi:SPASM domain peptide maturase of grasp-with-spasm system